MCLTSLCGDLAPVYDKLAAGHGIAGDMFIVNQAINTFGLKGHWMTLTDEDERLFSNKYLIDVLVVLRFR